jgi:hypothetical protein
MNGNASNPIPMSAWMHHSTIRFVERNPEATMVPKRVPISNETVFRAMSTTYEPVMRDTYFVNVVARRILSHRVSGKVYQEEEIFKAEQKIMKVFERVNGYFDTRIAQAEQKLQLAGYDADDLLARARSKTYEFESPTGLTNDYISLLIKANIYMVHNANLWAAGELGNSPAEALAAKLNNEREVRGQLFAVSRATTSAYNELRQLVNRVVEERREASNKRKVRENRRAEHERNAAAKRERQQAEQLLGMQADMAHLAAEPGEAGHLLEPEEAISVPPPLVLPPAAPAAAVPA